MKLKKIIFTVGLVLVSFSYLFLRLNRLDNLIGFRLDQGIHLLETKTMFDTKKVSLVGPMVTSKTFMGRQFFIGANYYYVLGIIGLIGQWNPLRITIIFIFLELGFYLFFIYFLKQKFNYFWALIIFIFISLSPYLIIHSRFFWNPHLLIPLSILVLYFGNKYLLKKRFKYLFLMAFCWGFGFACHYSAVFWGIFFGYFLIKSKQYLKIKVYLTVFLGFTLGNLPFIVFEIRHGFYNIKTIFYIFTNSVKGSELTSSHYFVFPLLIFGLYGFLIFINKIKNKKFASLVLIVTLGVMWWIQTKYITSYVPLDVIEGWNYTVQQKVADLIVKDGCPKNFEVAATVQGDTRAYDIRYLLNIRNCNPMNVEEYPKAEVLFLVAPIGRPPETEKVWEVDSLGKFKINRQEKLTEKVVFYELEKLEEKK